MSDRRLERIFFVAAGLEGVGYGSFVTFDQLVNFRSAFDCFERRTCCPVVYLPYDLQSGWANSQIPQLRRLRVPLSFSPQILNYLYPFTLQDEAYIPPQSSGA